MKSLSRNCNHHSTVFVVQDFGKAVYKSSSLPFGIKNIENEVIGYCWYNKFRSTEIIVSERLKTDHYMKIEIAHIDAITPNMSSGYLKNVIYIELAIYHYVEIWGQLPIDLLTFPVHGDYSIEGNILFKEDRVFVIDWEHFSEQGGALGFDAMYLLFETLLLDSTDDKKILIHIIKMIRILKEKNCIDPVFLYNPLLNTIQFMEKNQYIWGDQLNKMPILSYSTDVVSAIDDYINSELSI